MPADLSVQLLRHGYGALPRLWEKTADVPWPTVTTTRLLGRRALVVRGPEGARLFYDQDLVERAGVVPRPLADLLFGPGAVHGLDGEDHRHRKELFLHSWGPREVQHLGDLAGQRLREVADGWPQRVPFGLHAELVRVYGAAVLRWTGIDESPAEVERLSLAMAQVVDGFGFSPGAYVRGWRARLQLDRWAAAVVDDVRAGRRPLPEHGVLRELAVGTGSDLDRRTAGVELLNVLRPTVAVSWLGTWAARAVLRHPEQARRLGGPDGHEARRAFAQEVRRLTPFVPALAGRLRRDVDHGDEHGRAGDLVVLDVPGTDTDPRTWERPEEFLPDRFVAAPPPGPHELVPQGGGPLEGHRCPGEDVALTLLDRTLAVLSRTEFSVRTTEPRVDRMPTLPGHGLLVTRARHLDGSIVALATAST